MLPFRINFASTHSILFSKMRSHILWQMFNWYCIFPKLVFVILCLFCKFCHYLSVGICFWSTFRAHVCEHIPKCCFAKRNWFHRNRCCDPSIWWDILQMWRVYVFIVRRRLQFAGLIMKCLKWFTFCCSNT